MTTVVSIMDLDAWDAHTDVIVVVDPRRRRLVRVPRDIWCEEIGDRINTAYRVGGHDALLRGLLPCGLRVEHSVCIRRSAAESALADCSVTVPVRRHIKLWYPLTPTSNVHRARKPVDFVPPKETLSGERIHQWMGARYNRTRPEAGDLERIVRQQVLLRALLRSHFPFERVLKDPSFGGRFR